MDNGPIVPRCQQIDGSQDTSASFKAKISIGWVRRPSQLMRVKLCDIQPTISSTLDSLAISIIG